LRSLLGDCEDPATLRKALLLNYNPFPNQKKGVDDEQLSDVPTLRIPSPEMTFNIDPSGCKDVDDVLSIVLTNTTVELWITIADVVETILPHSALDIAASLQAFTAYDNGVAVKPMLPAGISEDKCSLLPGKERLGVSLVLSIDIQNPGMIVSSNWICSTVKNKKQYTYENFSQEGLADGIPVDLLEKTASGILGHQTEDPHEWIEAFMLKYNMEVAKLLRKERRGVLRSHKAPDISLLEKYQRIVGTDLTFLARQSAQYCHSEEKEARHYGLEAEVYCHATSPLRRYADLLNQRVLKDILLGMHTHVDPEFLWLNKRQKELKQYERDLFFLDQILLNKTGKVNAIVLEKRETKVIFWCIDWKRTVSWKPLNIPDSLEEGNSVVLSYFINPAGRNWKEKIVFRVD
jgi:exoribonuclease R